MIFFRKKMDPEVEDLLRALEEHVRNLMNSYYLEKVQVKREKNTIEALASTGESVVSLGKQGEKFDLKAFRDELVEGIESLLQSMGWSLEESLKDNVKLMSEAGIKAVGARDMGGGKVKITSPSGKQHMLEINLLDLKIKIGLKIIVK